jgi:hypothetical protein
MQTVAIFGGYFIFDFIVIRYITFALKVGLIRGNYIAFLKIKVCICVFQAYSVEK